MAMNAQAPDIEIRRQIRHGRHRGAHRTYATVYFRPLRVYVLGRWIIGRAAVLANQRAAGWRG